MLNTIRVLVLFAVCLLASSALAQVPNQGAFTLQESTAQSAGENYTVDASTLASTELFSSAFVVWTISDVTTAETFRLCINIYVAETDTWARSGCVSSQSAAGTLVIGVSGFVLKAGTGSAADNLVMVLPTRWRAEVDRQGGANTITSSIEVIPLGL